jgi:hypothetical protein
MVRVVLGKGKGKVVPVLKYGQLQARAALPPGKEPPLPIGYEEEKVESELCAENKKKNI